MRAERHTNAELARPLTNRVGHYSVDPNRGEHQGEQAQTAEQNCPHPRWPESKGKMLGHRFFVGDGNVIVDVTDNAMSLSQHRTRRAPRMYKNGDTAVGQISKRRV